MDIKIDDKGKDEKEKGTKKYTALFQRMARFL